MYIEVKRFLSPNRMAECAAHSIAQFLSLLALLLLLTGGYPAASSRLVRRLRNRTLERAQQRNLGSWTFAAD